MNGTADHGPEISSIVNNIDHNENENGSSSFFSPLDPSLCRVIQRVTVDKVVWCLLEVDTSSHAMQQLDCNCDANHSMKVQTDPQVQHNTDVCNEEKHSNDGLVASSKFFFWTSLNEFLSRHSSRQNSDVKTSANSSDALSQNNAFAAGTNAAKVSASVGLTEIQDCVALAISSGSSIALSCGIVLPASMEENVTNSVKNSVESTWKSISSQQKSQIAFLQSKVEALEADIQKLTEEYQKYKSRARSVLQQQADDLQKVNEQETRIAELQQEAELRNNRNAELELELRKLKVETQGLLSEKEGRDMFERTKLAEVTGTLQGVTAHLRATEKQLLECTEVHNTKVAELHKEFKISLDKVNDELCEYKKQSKHLLQEKDLQISSLQSKLFRTFNAGGSDRPHTPHTPTAVGEGLFINVNASNAGYDTPSRGGTSNHNLTSLTTFNLHSLIENKDVGGNTSMSVFGPISDGYMAKQLSNLVNHHFGDVEERADGVTGILAIDSEMDKGMDDQDSMPNLGSDPQVVMHLQALQATKDEKANQYRLKIQQLQEMVHQLQVSIAAQKSREAEYEAKISECNRSNFRSEQVQRNIEYLKNVIIKYMETLDHSALFPVLNTILQFSPEETASINEKRKRLASWW
jgi:uncharacterized small protein (DUF1192 family)